MLPTCAETSSIRSSARRPASRSSATSWLPTASTRALDRGERAERARRDLRSGADAFAEARDRDQHVRARKRADDSRAALQRRRDEPAVDACRDRADELVLPERREQLARQLHVDLARLRGVTPAEPLEQRPQEQLGADRGADGISRDPEQRDARLARDGQDERVPGTDRDAVHRDLAEPRERRGGMIVATGGRARVHDDDVAGDERARDRLVERGAIVAYAFVQRHLTAAAANARQRAALRSNRGSSPGRGDPTSTSTSSSPVVITATRGRRTTSSRSTPAEAQAARSAGARRRRAGTTTSLATASSPIARTCSNGATAARIATRVAAARLDELDRHDRVEAVGERIARVDDVRVAAELQDEGCRLARCVRARGDHRDPVHRAGVIVRRGQARERRRGRHPVERLGERERLGRIVRDAGGTQRRIERRARLLERDVVQEDGSRAHGVTTRTVSPAGIPLRSSGIATSASARTSVKIRFEAPNTGVACSAPRSSRASVHGT